MTPPPWSSEQLIALCQNSDPDHLLSVLQQPSAAQVVLSRESILVDRCTWKHVDSLNLHRMMVAAAKSGEVAAFDVLLEFGHQHNVSVYDMINTETIFAALHKNTVEIIGSIEAVVPDVLTRYSIHGSDLIELVAKGGPDSEPTPRSSWLPLVRRILDQPDVKFRDPAGLLWSACQKGSVQVVECLLEHGAIIAGSRALQDAASDGRLDIMDTLLRHGADVNEDDSALIAGNTALHWAASNNQTAAVKFLLEHGADATIRNGRGETAADVVPETGDEALKAFLGCDGKDL